MKKLIVTGIAALALAGVVGAGSAYALNGNGPRLEARSGQNGGYSTALESRASVLGMSGDELREALKTKTMSQIAVEQDLSEEAFRAKMTEAAKARWEARGLSDEEIAKRITERETRQAANSADHEFGSGEGQHFGGYGRNR